MLLVISEEENKPVVKLTGLELLKIGFNVGDIVNVVFSENQIVISKNEETNKLKKMAETNPTILKLVSEFNLDISVA